MTNHLGKAMEKTHRTIDIMIAGAQKSGTTSLAGYLAQHPEIGTHSQKTEFNYFIVEKEFKQGYDDVYEYYFQSNSDKQKILMGKSVGIMYSELAISRLHEHNPNCKIILILRNPVSRAYSAYWYMRRVGFETEKTFLEALECEEIRKKENTFESVHCLYRERGIYHYQVKNLYKYFGREKVYILLLEDLINSPTQTLRSIFDFMKVSKNVEIDTNTIKNKAKMARSETLAKFMMSRNPVKQILKTVLSGQRLKSIRFFVKSMNEVSFSPPQMDPTIRIELVDYFRPHNAELEKILHRSLKHWNK